MFAPYGGWPDKLRLRLRHFRIEPVRTGTKGEPCASNREMVALDRDQRPVINCPELIQPVRASHDRECHVVARARHADVEQPGALQTLFLESTQSHGALRGGDVKTDILSLRPVRPGPVAQHALSQGILPIGSRKLLGVGP
jgi:hypothetical protein